MRKLGDDITLPWLLTHLISHENLLRARNRRVIFAEVKMNPLTLLAAKWAFTKGTHLIRGKSPWEW